MVNINIGGLKGQGKYVSRKAGASKKTKSVARARATVRAGGRPGVTRVGGYYGRFTGPHAEKKFFDTTLAATAATTAGAVISDTLNIVPQDSTESGRIGRKVDLHAMWDATDAIWARSRSKTFA